MWMIYLMTVAVYIFIGACVTGTFVRVHWFPKQSHEFSEDDINMWKVLSVVFWPLTLIGFTAFHAVKWIYLLILSMVEWNAEVPWTNKQAQAMKDKVNK